MGVDVADVVGPVAAADPSLVGPGGSRARGHKGRRVRGLAREHGLRFTNAFNIETSGAWARAHQTPTGTAHGISQIDYMLTTYTQLICH